MTPRNIKTTPDPLALDYLFDEATEHPTYIEANPRLFELMNATLRGVNLADLSVRVAVGEMGASDEIRCGQQGRRSHNMLAILPNITRHGGSRREVLRTIQEASRRGGSSRW